MHAATIHPIDSLDRPEPGIDPIAAQMRDIILGKAVDGQPTMEDDLGGFTLQQIKTHFPTARRLADKIIVRQVDDMSGFETREALLTRATGLWLGKLPDEMTIHATLRAHGLTNAEIADIWPDLVERITAAFPVRHAWPFVPAGQH